jgi:hypothetical protein
MIRSLTLRPAQGMRLGHAAAAMAAAWLLSLVLNLL